MLTIYSEAVADVQLSLVISKQKQVTKKSSNFFFRVSVDFITLVGLFCGCASRVLTLSRGHLDLVALPLKVNLGRLLSSCH